MKPWVMDLLDRCTQAGFPLTGILDLERANEVTPGFDAHYSRYEEWVKKGHHGEMKYLERGLERRRDPRHLFPEAKSILGLAIPYRRASPTPIDDPKAPRYARYIQGADYHTLLQASLEKALSGWADDAVASDPSAPRPRWKICVDTSALLERTWARLAGLGWIGKNTLLMHPKHGSYLFLAFVLLDQESGEGPKLLPDYCGNCTRCLEACPTQALAEPHLLEARRCIAYLTLEKRGPIEDINLQEKTGRWVAGCDLCQEVCPFNRKPSREEETWPLLVENEATALRDWSSLLEETREEYKTRTKNSSLERVKWRDWQRNLAIALGNIARENPTVLPPLASLLEAKREEWKAEPDVYLLFSGLWENSKA